MINRLLIGAAVVFFVLIVSAAVFLAFSQKSGIVGSLKYFYLSRVTKPSLEFHALGERGKVVLVGKLVRVSPGEPTTYSYALEGNGWRRHVALPIISPQIVETATDRYIYVEGEQYRGEFVTNPEIDEVVVDDVVYIEKMDLL